MQVPEDIRDAKPELRILILEDNPFDAELIEDALREGGLVFISKIVDNELGYIKALREFRPDLILSDYDLPRFSGWEALQIKKELTFETPFILVTGAVGEERAIQVLTNGATDYVLKSNLSRLLPSCRQGLKGIVRAPGAKASIATSVLPAEIASEILVSSVACAATLKTPLRIKRVARCLSGRCRVALVVETAKRIDQQRNTPAYSCQVCCYRSDRR